MSADTCQLAALKEQVDGHAAKLAHADAQFDALFLMMREACRHLGVDPGVCVPALTVVPGGAPPGRRARPRGRLHAVTDGRP